LVNEAAILNKLNLGTSAQVLTASTDSPLSALLKDLTQGVIDELGRNIDKYNISASNNLKQSIKPTKIVSEKDSVSIGISAEFYWKYVNYGVNGISRSHGAPNYGKENASAPSFYESINQWVRNRGITATDISYEQLTFAIMKHVQEEGKAPRPFFTDVVNDNLVKVLQKPIEKLIGRAITVTIIDPWQ
jgi:hypothetical protein